MNTATEGIETPLCDACRRIPISHLSLDIAEPIDGWLEFFAKRNVIGMDDHLGRPSIPRYVLGDLIAEHRHREARLAERPHRERVLVPAGTPALDEATPYESMMAAGGVSPAEEFVRRRPNFLEEELAAGRRQAADRAEAVRRVKDELAGSDE